MPFNVLDVQAMPRGERSRTRQLHRAFFRGLREAWPEAQVFTRDVATDYDALPAFDEWDVEAKFEMMYGQGQLNETGARRWEALTALTDELHAADLVVISSPMWNFSVPWFLKRWIDAVVQGRLTFEVVDGQYVGLLKGRRAVLLATRDGAYAAGSPWAAMDHQLPWLEQVLGFMGLGPIDRVVAEPMTGGGPEVAARALEVAVAQAEALGRAVRRS